MNVLTRKFQGTKELIALVDVLQGASCLSEVLGHRQTVAGGLHRGVSNAMVPLIAHSAKPVEVSWLVLVVHDSLPVKEASYS